MAVGQPAEELRGHNIRVSVICPGFIDAHTHLTHERSVDFNQGFVDSMRREVAEEAIRSTVYARRTIEAGFTTVDHTVELFGLCPECGTP